MSGWRFVVAEGDVDAFIVGADAIVIDRLPGAALLEASAADTERLQAAGGERVSVFRNAAVARTAFEHVAGAAALA